jgi:AcrR family transcriptional regulator
MKDRHMEIFETAVRIFGEKGYRATSLQDVSNELGITRPALYYYIKSKQELLIKIYDQVTDKLFDQLRPIVLSSLPPDVKLKKVMMNHIHIVIDNKTLLSVFYAEKSELPTEKRSYITRREREYGKMIERVYIEGMNEGFFRPCNPTVFVNSTLGMFNWMPNWFRSKGPLSMEEVSDMIVQIIGSGYLEQRKNESDRSLS